MMSKYPTYEEWQEAFLWPVAAMFETEMAMHEFLTAWGG